MDQRSHALRVGPIHRSEPGEEPYPEVMNRGAIEEMAALNEVAARYAEGRRCCDRAIAVCRRYPDVAGIPARQVKALLHAPVDTSPEPAGHAGLGMTHNFLR